MCKFKATNGQPLRPQFQAFEVDAIRFGIDNNYKSGDTFQWGKTCEDFIVTERTNNIFECTRVSTGKVLRVYITESEPFTDDQQPQPQPQPVQQQQVQAQQPAPAPVQPQVQAPDANAMAGLFAALQAFMPKTQIDEAQVRELVFGYINEIKDANTCKVQVNDKEPVKLQGVMHEKFERVLKRCARRRPVWLYGPAGTGKNVLAEQVAQALELPFYTAASLQTVFDLIGYTDAAGVYQETNFFRAFTQGGVFLLDEIDATAPEVFVAFNQALANGYYPFPKHGNMKAHPDFIAIAAGNTAGMGASDAYNGRFKIDQSTRDRFTFIELEYDKRIELACANDDNALVDFAHAMRKAIQQQHLTYTCGTRTIKRIAEDMELGVSLVDIMVESVCGGWSVDDIRLIARNIDCSNKYANALKSI